MRLPVQIRACLDRLEQAGFAAFCVGGSVRDWLLGLQPHDYDLCTAATPEEIKAVFAGCRMVLAGEKHGTVGIVTDSGVVEITTFRTEGSYADNRHPDRVEFVTSVDDDLARRDFTVNAMAWSPDRGLRDPFGGQRDLENGILRAVGDPAARFREDSLRILRGVRFAVRFRLQPEPQTLLAMKNCAGLMDNLARERVFDELCKLLPLVSADDLVLYAPIVTQVIPELRPCVGFRQHNPHHIHDVYTHIAHVTADVPADLTLRWAALLHDVGKSVTFTMDEQGCGHFYGHAGESARMAEEILCRLKAPKALRERVVLLIAQHMTYPEPDEKQLRRRLSRLGSEAMEQLLILQEADTGSKGMDKTAEPDYFARIRAILRRIEAENACLKLKDLAVNGNDLLALGIRGKAIGRTLNALLERVIDEKIPNEKSALLAAAREEYNGNTDTPPGAKTEEEFL